MTVYGILNCDTCRKARRYLDEHGIEHRFHDLRDDGLDIQMLERWADAVGWEKLVNRRSLTWRKIPASLRRTINRERAFAAMLEQPTLVKRPVLEADEFTAVGFSEKRFADFLSKSA